MEQGLVNHRRIAGMVRKNLLEPCEPPTLNGSGQPLANLDDPAPVFS
jgi:hypothetical protein